MNAEYCPYELLADGRWRCPACGDATSYARDKPPIRRCGKAPPPPPPGPCVFLKRILAAYGFAGGLKNSTSCMCDELCAAIDHWWNNRTLDEHRAEIIAALRESQSKTGWGEAIKARAMGARFVVTGEAFVPDWRHPDGIVGSLLDEAISRASESV